MNAPNEQFCFGKGLALLVSGRGGRFDWCLANGAGLEFTGGGRRVHYITSAARDFCQFLCGRLIYNRTHKKLPASLLFVHHTQAHTHTLTHIHTLTRAGSRKGDPAHPSCSIISSAHTRVAPRRNIIIFLMYTSPPGHPFWRFNNLVS